MDAEKYEKQLSDIAQELWIHRGRQSGDTPDQNDRERAERILNQIDSSEDNSVKYRELYKILRAYVVHEDNLINNRLGWLLTSQGLLFSAYAFSLGKENISKLHIVIFILGISISIISFIIVSQAQMAIESLRKSWQDLENFSDKELFPQLTSGLKSNESRSSSDHLLSRSVLAIPLAFFIAWICLSGVWDTGIDFLHHLPKE